MMLMERQRTPQYNCAHFLCDAWEEETGQDIRPIMGCFLHPRLGRTADLALVRALRLLTGPQAPCVVMLRRRGASPHVGLYVRGRVLHLTDNGPMRQLVQVARVGFDSVRYYAPR